MILARAYLLAGILLVSVSAASAETPEGCAKVATDAARLECFDLIFRKSVQTPNTKGRWSSHVTKSKLDDTTNAQVWVQSVEPHTNRFGKSEPVVFAIDCSENTTALWINFAGEFMSSLQGRGEVTYRIDDRPKKERQFRESNDHMALGLWSGGQAIPFAKDLFGGKRLLVRAVPFSEGAVTAEFDIAGLEEAIKPLREACKW